MNSDAIIRKEMIIGKFRSKLTFIFGTGDLEDVESIIDFYEQKVNQLEEDYKNEVEENLKLSELWQKSQEEKRQLETNRDEVIEYIKNDMPYLQEIDKEYEDTNGDTYFTYKEYDGSVLLEILERGKNENNIEKRN